MSGVSAGNVPRRRAPGGSGGSVQVEEPASAALVESADGDEQGSLYTVTRLVWEDECTILVGTGIYSYNDCGKIEFPLLSSNYTSTIHS